jgi:glycosyltransferase involved in cell wall biosynthesis
MRICQIITTLVYGGAERLLADFCNIHSAGHSIDIIYLKETPHMASKLAPSIRVHYVPLGKGIVGRLRRKVRELSPDIVHTHLGHADLLGMIACAGLPVRRFCTMHNIHFKFGPKDRAIWLAYAFLFRTAARDCQVVSISYCVAEHVRKRLYVPDARNHVIRNAIPELRPDESKAAVRMRLGIAEDRFCVLFVGRLVPQKDVGTLLRAAALARVRIPGLLVLIVGAGPLRADLERIAAEAGLGDTVRFEGTTPRPEEYFHAADAFTLPSIYEGLGIVILEAFRASLPVAATNLEGPRELIRDGENGFLFPSGDAAALAERLSALNADPGLRAAVGAEGRKDYLKEFTMDKNAAALEGLYLGGRGGTSAGAGTQPMRNAARSPG